MLDGRLKSLEEHGVISGLTKKTLNLKLRGQTLNPRQAKMGQEEDEADDEVTKVRKELKEQMEVMQRSHQESVNELTKSN